MKKRVFIAVGHGGSDSGAVAGNKVEKVFNLDIAIACMNELQRHAVDVKMSRAKDENDPVAEEVRESNNFRPNVTVAIHCNAGGGDGIEVFHSRVGGTGKVLAKDIIGSVVAETGQNSRGVKTRLNDRGTDYYMFIRETEAPAVIVECAFLDSVDVEIIDTYEERQRMGVAIAHGILNTLQIAIEPVISRPDNSENSDKLYRVQVGAYVDKVNADNILNKLKAQGYNAIIKYN